MVEYPRKPAPKEDSNGSLIEYHPNKKPKGDAAGIWLGYGDGTSHLRDVGPDFPKHKSDYQPVDAKKFTDTPGYVAHRIYYTMPSTNRKTQPTEQRVVINVANYDAYAQWDYMFCVNGRGSETGVFRNH